MGSSGSAGPILVADRFAPLRAHLLELLAGFSDSDWVGPTVAPGWSVKDVAAHLLGGDVGILSRKRDGTQPSSAPITDYNQLRELVDRLNREWIVATRRMSTLVLRELLADTSPRVEAYFLSLDPMAMGGPVSWAGPELAPVWLDVAREFTERWHHQQQMRDATGRPPLYDPYFLSPVLDAFVRALPHNFRGVASPQGTVVRFEISGDAGGTWFVHRTKDSWTLAIESEAAPATDVVVSQDVAWRLFTKGIDRASARAGASIRGDAALAAPIFATTSVIG